MFYLRTGTASSFSIKRSKIENAEYFRLNTQAYREEPDMTPEHPIILCGFTSSGKTTIGKLLSEQLGLPFYDTDQMLIEHYRMTIPEIFAKGGESLFRDYEHEIARQVCGLGPSVISTGGGMLTFDRNGEILAKSGTIFYIDRPFEDCYRNLALHPERPLFKNHTKEEVQNMYLTRRELYKKYAKYNIPNAGIPQDAVAKICAVLSSILAIS